MDICHWYPAHNYLDVLHMPREIQDMLISGIPRIQAQLSLLHADAHMYTKLTEEARKELRQQWTDALNSTETATYGDVRRAILYGELTDPDEIQRLMPNAKIARSYEDVAKFLEG